MESQFFFFFPKVNTKYKSLTIIQYIYAPSKLIILN